ncbi:MAG: CocE/NonD family hydrolase, partial [Acidimicrobiales bacterium]
IDLATHTAFSQVIVRGAEPGAEIRATDPQTGETLQTGVVSDAGTVALLGLPEQDVRLDVWSGGKLVAHAGSVNLPGVEPPAQRHYDAQLLQPGFNYIETRDGTLLSAFVTMPAGSVDPDVSFPTLVEYSGYALSNPNGTDPARLTIPLLGYALVQVNVRGTGCSGGVYDGFAQLERLDGYDVIETVAAQSWSDGIGMWGISYPGIMQLHVASTRPPSLDAIAPLSVIASIDETLFPGGIFNNGFGQRWTTEVGAAAEPLGQPWTRDVIAAGDTLCEDNQSLRIHNPDLVSSALNKPFSTELSRTRSPESFVGEITVPVYLAGAWHDEQTGGGFTQLLDDFDNASSFRATLYNGLHIDPLAPAVLAPLLEFYDLYVARRSPLASPLLDFVIGAGAESFFGAELAVPESDLDGLDYETALQFYEAQEPIRVLYEVGAEQPNLPEPRFVESFSAWPIEETNVLEFSLRADGVLQTESSEVDQAVTGQSVVGSFTSDPSEGSQLTSTRRSQIWGATPNWRWPLAEETHRARHVTAGFEETVVLTGSAVAELLVRLPDGEPDADLEVTLSDLAPDGSETFIQSGWLRLSRRAGAEGNTALNHRITNREGDIRPVDAGETVEASVGTLPFAHVVREGHQLVMTIDTPGASRAEWAFDVIPDPIRIEILAGSVLRAPQIQPDVIQVAIPVTAPACGSLRAQPCRPGSSTSAAGDG